MSTLADPASGYPKIIKWLHWGIFFLMAAQFTIGYALEELDEDEGFSEDRLFVLHAAFGLTILLLAIVRTWWRLTRPLPAWAPTLSRFERRYAHQVERVLYLLMYTIPLSGLGLAIADERRLPILGRFELSDLFEDAEDFFEFAHVGSHIVFFAFFALT